MTSEGATRFHPPPPSLGIQSCIIKMKYLVSQENLFFSFLRQRLKPRGGVLSE
uniref:Uncharacterized protein n=1 Tax=Anguilla anguilla TaxID=7936 RepID=A0A0E9QZY4_ANGAN